MQPGLFAAAAGTLVVGAATIAYLRYRDWLLQRKKHKSILVAACDLDKTMYPPAGANQASQLAANVAAMTRFESLGGFVFPVTGNNPPQAQVKFLDTKGVPLRDVSKHPGIFCNGGLVLGPGGVELERHTLGKLHVKTSGIDLITALLDFWSSPTHRALLKGIGLLFFLPDVLAGYDEAYDHVEGFCDSQRVVPVRRGRKEIIAERDRVLQVVLLWPPLAPGASYDQDVHPWQLSVRAAIEEAGLADCAGSGASGIKFTPMKEPWPEMDLCVGGVDKGSALSRFLQHPDVTAYLGVARVEPDRHVAVFGDAANDVPMFRAVHGVSPALRVAMPHAGHAELLALANVRAEVSEVLNQCCHDREEDTRGNCGGCAIGKAYT